MKTYSLKCLAPDGAAVREGDFPSIESAWDRSNDMGSRWFFYPVHVVTGPSRSPKARIVAAPQGLEGFIGRPLSTLSAAFAQNSDAICAWINGEAPLFLTP